MRNLHPRYDKLMKKYEAFDAWFIADERQVVKNCLRDITEYVYTANSIYPSIMVNTKHDIKELFY